MIFQTDIKIEKLIIIFFYIYLIGFLTGLRPDVFPLILIVISFIVFFFILLLKKNYGVIEKIFSKKTIILVFFSQSAGWFLCIFFKYYSFNLYVWDIGAFANPVSNLMNGYGFYNSFTGTPQLAEHFSPALLLFIPFFLVKQTLIFLMLAKFVSYILSFIILSKLCDEYKLSDLSKRFIQFIWLMNPLIYNFMTHELQPSSFALPLILGAFLVYKKGKVIQSVILILLTLLFKESMVFAVLAFGLFLLVEEKKIIIGLLLIIFSIAAGYFIIYVLPLEFYSMNNIHKTEINLFKYVPEKIILLIKAFVFFLLIPLIRWKLLPMLIASLGLSLFLANEYKITLDFHYGDMPSAFFIFAVVLILSHFDFKLLLQRSVYFLTIFIILFSFFILNSKRSSVNNLLDNIPDSRSIERLSATERIKDNYFSSGKSIIANGTIAAYLFNYNRINFIKNRNDILILKDALYVLDSIPSWPLSIEENNLLIEELREMEKKGLLKQRPEFLPLLLFDNVSE